MTFFFFLEKKFFRSSDFFAVALVWNSKDRFRDKTPTAEHVFIESEVFQEIDRRASDRTP